MKHALITLALGSATAVALTVGAPAAIAHETPEKGSTCTVSGTVLVDHGEVFVCTSGKAGAKPTWGRGLPLTATPLTMSDGWAKSAKKGMSAAFGVLTNPSQKAIRVVAATSPYAKVVQLHEVVTKDGSMVMQQKTGGFVVPAKGTVELTPEGSHLMLQGITKPIAAGTMVPVTLITADGGTVLVKVLARAG